MTNQELITATLADMSEIELRNIAAELQKALAKSEETAEQRYNWWQRTEESCKALQKKIDALKAMVEVL